MEIIISENDHNEELYRINEGFKDILYGTVAIDLKLHSVLNDQNNAELVKSVTDNLDSICKQFYRLNALFDAIDESVTDIRFDVITIEQKLLSVLNDHNNAELAKSVTDNINRIHKQINGLDALLDIVR